MYFFLNSTLITQKQFNGVIFIKTLIVFIIQGLNVFVYLQMWINMFRTC